MYKNKSDVFSVIHIILRVKMSSPLSTMDLNITMTWCITLM